MFEIPPGGSTAGPRLSPYNEISSRGATAFPAEKENAPTMPRSDEPGVAEEISSVPDFPSAATVLPDVVVIAAPVAPSGVAKSDSNELASGDKPAM